MKKTFIFFLILFLSACGEKAEEKAFLDKNIKSFLEYNEIAGVTPKIQLSNVLTKMTEVKMHIQDYKFSKDCQHSVGYLVDNMNIVLDFYKNFMNDDTYNVEDAVQAYVVIDEFTKYKSCKKANMLESNKLLLQEVSKYNPNIELIKEYIKNGADVNIQNEDGDSLLILACDDFNLAKLLVDNGANINFKTKSGYTPLMCALHMMNESSLDTIRMFIEKGADINAIDEKGKSILMYAVDNNTPKALDIVKLLINKGANINITDVAGYTVLMHSVNSDNLQIVKLLVEKGIDVNAKNSKNQTALDIVSLFFEISKSPQKKEIIKFLKEQGAK